MPRSRPTSRPRSINRSGRSEGGRRSRRLGKSQVSDGSEPWRSGPSNAGVYEPSGVLSSSLGPGLARYERRFHQCCQDCEPVLGTECSWFLVTALPEHGVLLGSSQVAAGLAELLV